MKPELESDTLRRARFAWSLTEQRTSNRGERGVPMLELVLGLARVSLLAVALPSPAADDIIARYVQRIGGMDKIQAVATLRRTGKFTSAGGLEAVVVRENKRPSKVREEFSLQGMTGINAYDGVAGWKISPFQGK